MAAITWTNVTDFAPGLSTFDTDAQTDVLAYVNTGTFNIAHWGGEESPTLRLGRIYLAAHMATVALSGAAGGAIAGPVTAEAAGGLSRSYGSMSGLGADTLLDTTPFGRAFRELLRRLPGPKAVCLL